MEETIVGDRSLRVIASSDRITFMTPNVGVELVAEDLIKSQNTTGMMFWALFSQLRNVDASLQGINESLQEISKKATDPNAVANAGAQASAMVDTILAQFAGSGLKMPQGFEAVVRTATQAATRKAG